MEIELYYAIPLLVIGWVGIHFRKTALGGVVAILIAWQGLLALAAMAVFQREKNFEGAVFLWALTVLAMVSVMTILTLGLRRYYAGREVEWRRNEEIRH